MKKKLGILMVVFVLITLAACGKDEKRADSSKVPEPLKVDLTVTEQVDVNGTVKMAALVTQGDEKVEDADEVVYEIWEEGKKDESVKIESVNEKEGLYTANTVFDHDGLFHIQVHVSARDMHTMPMKEVTVGGGGHYDAVEKGEDHAHSAGFSMHFTAPKTVKVDEEQELSVHIQMDTKPLEKLHVRYEIWNEANPEEREWLDAEEMNAGEYMAEHTFVEAGTYSVQIHVKDDQELHEHEVHTLIVE
ncbi:FixH family protein [Filibacter tadaridae]|uniref:YtkA-like domain-containing protein n=1 Tax=Filibacter tadaridae TaxID=2483811 RepID=A0A3P5XWM4_9BACL|nr:FixH family protein [Filibacter tadaridae]VDC33530.1 hypothetical protein FILTAD_02940 [Filibacter tadaridae]